MRILVIMLAFLALSGTVSCSHVMRSKAPATHTDSFSYEMSAPNEYASIERLGSLPPEGSITVAIKLIDYSNPFRRWVPSAYLSLYDDDQMNSFRVVLIDQGNEHGQFAAYEYLRDGEYQFQMSLKENIPLNTPVQFDVTWNAAGSIVIQVDGGDPIHADTSLTNLRYMTVASGVKAHFAFNE